MRGIYLNLTLQQWCNIAPKSLVMSGGIWRHRSLSAFVRVMGFCLLKSQSHCLSHGSHEMLLIPITKICLKIPYSEWRLQLPAANQLMAIVTGLFATTFNKLNPRQNGRHFPDVICRFIVNEHYCIWFRFHKLCPRYQTTIRRHCFG